MSKIQCERCNGSGEIGVRSFCPNAKEAPGPVPDDARGWFAKTCPDCRGSGDLYDDEDGEFDE